MAAPAPRRPPPVGAARSGDTRLSPKKVINGRFELGTALGEGCYGKVYRAVDAVAGSEVAMKVEKLSMGSTSLVHEASILRSLAHPEPPQGFARFLYCGREGLCQLLVMELLSESLQETLQDRCGGRFTAATTVLVAQQMLCRFEYLHSRGIVHQDTKPDNFAWGVAEKRNHLYLIDFGLSKVYFKKRHLRMCRYDGLVGTARYASVNAHQAAELSRRDDLESIGYVLLYLFRGSLPWSGLKAKDSAEKNQLIKGYKETLPLGALCRGLPLAFQRHIEYCRSLAFKERPNYQFLHALYRDAREGLAKAQGSPLKDFDFEWNLGKDYEEGIPLQPQVPLCQPDDASCGWKRDMVASCLSLGKANVSRPAPRAEEPNDVKDLPASTPTALAGILGGA